MKSKKALTSLLQSIDAMNLTDMHPEAVRKEIRNLVEELVEDSKEE